MTLQPYVYVTLSGTWQCSHLYVVCWCMEGQHHREWGQALVFWFSPACWEGSVRILAVQSAQYKEAHGCR
jgi:hypothetical protein